MEISIQITKDVAYALASSEAELSRVAIEALAIEGYRQNRLSEHQIAQMLQLGGRMDVHAFLKARKVPHELLSGRPRSGCEGVGPI
jgi:hypothetical protein